MIGYKTCITPRSHNVVIAQILRLFRPNSYKDTVTVGGGISFERGGVGILPFSAAVANALACKIC